MSDRFTSVATLNYLTWVEMRAWSNWMRAQHEASSGSAQNIAKRVLGRQAYTQNLSYRNWVWEFEFMATFENRRRERRRYRLFASKRGFTLEIEVPEGHDPWDLEVRVAASQALAHFLKIWKLAESLRNDGIPAPGV